MPVDMERRALKMENLLQNASGGTWKIAKKRHIRSRWEFNFLKVILIVKMTILSVKMANSKWLKN